MGISTTKEEKAEEVAHTLSDQRGEDIGDGAADSGIRIPHVVDQGDKHVVHGRTVQLVKVARHIPLQLNARLLRAEGDARGVGG